MWLFVNTFNELQMTRLTFLIIVSLLFGIVQSHAQVKPQLSKEDYLAKSKKEQRAATAMLAGGAIACGVGAILIKDNLTLGSGSNAGESIGAALFVVGGLTALLSIPAFINAGYNKRKAAEMTYEYRPLQVHPVMVQHSREHALVFRIALE